MKNFINPADKQIVEGDSKTSNQGFLKYHAKSTLHSVHVCVLLQVLRVLAHQDSDENVQWVWIEESEQCERHIEAFLVETKGQQKWRIVSEVQKKGAKNDHVYSVDSCILQVPSLLVMA